MRPLDILRRWTLLSSITMVTALGVVSQSFAIKPKSNPKASSNYVIMGAFSFQRNAQRFTSVLREKEFQASYKLNSSRQLFYVYVYTSPQKDEAVQELTRIRSNYPEFKDAWLFQGSFEEAEVVAGGTKEEKEEIPETEVDISSEEVISSAKDPVSEQQDELVKREGIHRFYFNTVNTKNYKEVKGRVKVIDPVRAKEIMTAKSHEMVEVREPNNRSNKIKISSDIFGFKEVQHILDLDNPLTDSTATFVDIQGDSIIVDFALERYKKGDVLVMYNVYFFRDAAIMRPESIYELNSLLDMLQENGKYKVRIHGHTNGRASGKILHLDEKDKNFFSLEGNHKKNFGSAKKLSLYRAYTIQHWLMDQGIAKDRMEIKGWGGKQMLYDKHHNQADRNVRVEIEITAD